MEVDVLDYATERISLMEYNNRQWRPVTYLSKFLNKIKRY